jgi:hypothetical protein
MSEKPPLVDRYSRHFRTTSSGKHKKDSGQPQVGRGIENSDSHGFPIQQYPAQPGERWVTI